MVQYKIGGDEIIPFYGSRCVFSNFFSCDLIYNTISFKSSEQAYQYSKSIFLNHPEVAERVLLCDNAYNAKMAVKCVFSRSEINDWKIVSRSIMYKILLAKYEHCPLFREALRSSKSSKLMETNQWDSYWGCGISMETLLNRNNGNNGNYSGDNVMGHLLEQIRSEKSWDLFINN